MTNLANGSPPITMPRRESQPHDKRPEAQVVFSAKSRGETSLP